MFGHYTLYKWNLSGLSGRALSKTRIGRLSQPAQSLQLVSLDAMPTVIASIDQVLRLAVTLDRCSMKQTECLNIFRSNSFTAIEPFSFAHESIEINLLNRDVFRQHEQRFNHLVQNAIVRNLWRSQLSRGIWNQAEGVIQTLFAHIEGTPFSSMKITDGILLGLITDVVSSVSV